MLIIILFNLYYLLYLTIYFSFQPLSTILEGVSCCIIFIYYFLLDLELLKEKDYIFFICQYLESKLLLERSRGCDLTRASMLRRERVFTIPGCNCILWASDLCALCKQKV